MKKSLLLTFFMMLVAVLGMAQTTSWPITLTKADGLPGLKGPKNYTFKSPVYQLDEPVSKLRFTVIATKTTDANTTAYDGFTVGTGPGFPFFSMAELKIFNADGETVTYTATSNAQSSQEGPTENLYDGKFGTFFHSTYYKGPMPQAYHYLELTLSEPVNTFSVEWLTRTNLANEPTYVGITPGTEYGAYPEQEFKLGNKVTMVEELAEGGLFVIRDNAPEYWYSYNNGEDSFQRGGYTKNKTYYHCPGGGSLTPDAATVVYLVPQPEKNTYKVAWLNGCYFIAKSEGTGWTLRTPDEIDAAPVKFTPSEDSEGDFVLTTDNDKFIYIADAIGKMSMGVNEPVDSIAAHRSRPFSVDFSIYKASVNNKKVKEILTTSIDEAEKRMALYGKNENEDKGEFDSLRAAVNSGKEIISDIDATPDVIIAASTKINNLLPAYVAIGIYSYTDSLQTIIDLFDSGDLTMSDAPNWLDGTYPSGSNDILRSAKDAAEMIIDTYTCVADIDKAIAEIMKTIDNFWASKITGVKDIPFRIGNIGEGLPGTLVSSCYTWESPLYLLTEEVEALRFTVFDTNNNGIFGETVFPTLAEFQIFDANGNQVQLTEDNFTTNSICTTDGAGLAGLCDGNTGTYYHSAYKEAHGFDGSTYVYIEVKLPEPMSAFKYKQIGRSNQKNTPTDFVFGYAGVDITPEEVGFDDPNRAKLGEKITSVNQITDDGIYALQGLISCDPFNCFEEEPREPRFYSGIKSYGKELQSPCAFSIVKTGDEDGTFYIQSMADGKYLAKHTAENGWGNASSSYYITDAAKVFITPNNNIGLPGSFVIYEYSEGLMRDSVERPYVIFQDWNDAMGTFSVDALENNDLDGEGEWYIYKMTMNDPYLYWLTSLVSVAESLGLEQSSDPGYYNDLGSFPVALAAAQAALDAKDDAAAQNAAIALSKALADTQSATAINPVVEGVYVIESAYDEYFNKQGVKKALFVYLNDELQEYITTDTRLYWGDAPEGDYKEANPIYHFELISAKESSQVTDWIEEGKITAEQAEQAYYIRNVAYDCYIGKQEKISTALGTTDTAEVVYIIRNQVATKFDIWHPIDGWFSLHTAGHSSGSGKGSDVCYWKGSDGQSQWRLRTVSNKTSIDDIVVAEGDEVVSVSYYTTAGVSVPVPVKGINIVKTVYANGVIKSEKIFVK